MHKLLIISTLITLLNAQNPKPYCMLGDVIYNNLEKISYLKTMDIYKRDIEDIKEYIKEVKLVKKDGYDIESSKPNSSKKKYLNKLRELSKKNDFYLRSIVSNYRNAIETENTELFLKIINNKLIDLKKNKKEILNYYFSHSDDINTTGVIKKYLKENKKLKIKKAAQKKYFTSTKIREKNKIKRIRKNDKIARKKIEDKLEKELQKKKLEIRNHQKRELQN